jgi:hypothetical protein
MHILPVSGWSTGTYTNSKGHADAADEVQSG